MLLLRVCFHLSLHMRFALLHFTSAFTLVRHGMQALRCAHVSSASFALLQSRYHFGFIRQKPPCSVAILLYYACFEKKSRRRGNLRCRLRAVKAVCHAILMLFATRSYMMLCALSVGLVEAVSFWRAACLACGAGMLVCYIHAYKVLGYLSPE